MESKIITQSGKVHLKQTQDVSAVLKDNADMRQINQTGEVRKIASIPTVLVLKLKDEYGIDVFALNKDTRPRLMKLLNSPEFQHLKTINGKV
jgi:alpha-mannosidase